MNLEQLEIAISKAPDEKSRAALQAMKPALAAVVQSEATFVQRIEASKTARGEGATKLSKRKKQEVDGYQSDAIELGRKHTESLKKFERPDTIIRIIQSGLAQDIEFWGENLKHVHQAELPIVQENLAVKRKLLGETNTFLAEFGPPLDRRLNHY